MSALRFCERRPLIIQEKNDGTAFENFVLEALTTRIITRMIAENSDPDEGFASFRFRNLFPSDVSRVVVPTSSPCIPGQTDFAVSKKVGDLESTGPSYYCIHGISSETSLAKMLSSPLYYLFPLGLEELDRIIAIGEVRIISSLVEGASSNHHGQFDFSITVNAKRCKTPIHVVVSKAATADSIDLTPQDRIALTSCTALPTELRNEVQTIWRSMESSIRTIMQDYMNCSIFPVVQDATRCCDLVLLCRDGTNPEAYHFVALEVKDSRNTSSQDWQEQLVKLTSSCRCIFPRLRAAMEKKGVALTYHIVFAGREE